MRNQFFSFSYTYQYRYSYDSEETGKLFVSLATKIRRKIYEAKRTCEFAPFGVPFAL